MGQADPVHVLTTVARLVAEAGSLRDIVPRLAVTLRTSIPFERLHVLRLDRAESFVLYVARDTGALEITRAPRRRPGDVARDGGSRSARRAFSAPCAREPASTARSG